MMRPGDKLRSYEILARALGRMRGPDWCLTIVGDGPARAEVEAAFSAVRSQVFFAGTVLDGECLDAFYRDADVYVWPAVNEAYGIAFLEAQATGLPCVAGDFGGVRDVVADGETGVIVEPGNPSAFAKAISDLLTDPGRRLRLGRAAERLAAERHSLPAAAAILRGAIEPLLALSGDVVP